LAERVDNSNIVLGRNVSLSAEEYNGTFRHSAKSSDTYSRGLSINALSRFDVRTLLTLTSPFQLEPFQRKAWFWR
jgi:hypothetical protein